MRMQRSTSAMMRRVQDPNATRALRAKRRLIHPVTEKDAKADTDY
jgi:hypothetical protein